MILLFGGTSDSLELMNQLRRYNQDVTLSVATDYGKIYSKDYAPFVIQKRMDQAEMVTFMQKNSIDLVIDASHPFADIVSKNAVAAARELNVKYVRYERARTALPAYVEKVESIEAACQLAMTYLSDDTSIYLTTGSKSLQDYVTYLPLNKIVTRVLPTAEVIGKCEELGLEAQQIHAIKGPFSEELNKSLYRKANASVMITKESGLSGGTDVKMSAAHALNMKVIVIKRPVVEYPIMFESINEVVSYVLKERKDD